MLLGREHISKGFKFSKIVRGLLKKGRRGGGGSDRFTDLDFFFGGGGKGEGSWQKEVRSIFQGGADTLGGHYDGFLESHL